MIVYLNYALLAQFAALSVGWLIAGDKMQAIYWLGALACTAGVTFKGL
jgi:drug/metabolite transporter (DMT)-like permease